MSACPGPAGADADIAADAAVAAEVEQRVAIAVVTFVLPCASAEAVMGRRNAPAAGLMETSFALHCLWPSSASVRSQPQS